MPEWCPCLVCRMLVASGCGRVLVRGCALLVVFVVLYWYCLRLLSCSESIGYGSRRFGRACLGMALLPVVPTYSRGWDSIGVIQYIGYSMT